MLISLLSTITDTPAVQHRLENWGPTIWVGVIVLISIVAAVTTFIASIIPRELNMAMSICANALYVFYGYFLYLMMRHISYDFLVWMIAISIAITMCVAIYSSGENNPVSYGIAVASNLAPAALDLWVARSLTSIPLSWAATLAAVAAIAAIFAWVTLSRDQ